MIVDHHDEDECARFAVEYPLLVLGFDEPVTAGDLKEGDFFRDAAEISVWAGRWMVAVSTWEPPTGRTVHVFLDEADPGELAEARRSLAYERWLELREQDAR